MIAIEVKSKMAARKLNSIFLHRPDLSEDVSGGCAAIIALIIWRSLLFSSSTSSNIFGPVIVSAGQFGRLKAWIILTFWKDFFMNWSRCLEFWYNVLTPRWVLEIMIWGPNMVIYWFALLITKRMPLGLFYFPTWELFKDQAHKREIILWRKISGRICQRKYMYLFHKQYFFLKWIQF